MIRSDWVRQELDKAASLVETARRLLATGTMVDLAALEGKVQNVCNGVVDLDRGEGQSLCPGMEALIASLDLLEAAMRDRCAPPAAEMPPDSDPGPEN